MSKKFRLVRVGNDTLIFDYRQNGKTTANEKYSPENTEFLRNCEENYKKHT